MSTKYVFFKFRFGRGGFQPGSPPWSAPMYIYIYIHICVYIKTRTVHFYDITGILDYRPIASNDMMYGE
jgi:hypothetical protein